MKPEKKIKKKKHGKKKKYEPIIIGGIDDKKEIAEALQSSLMDYFKNWRERLKT